MAADGTGALAGVPWVGLGITTAAAAVMALGVNLGVRLLLAVPDGAEAGPAIVMADEAASDEEDAEIGAEGEDGVDAAAPASVTALSEQRYLDSILGRNLFDASKIGLEADGDAPCEPGTPGCDDGPPADLSVVLVGTVVADIPAYSAAFIQIDGQSSSYAYGIDQYVSNAQVRKIEKDRVQLQRNGREFWISIGGERKDKSTASTVPSSPAEAVASESETEFTVERSFIDEQLSDLAGLSRMARALLHRGPDGEYDGYRLSAIRRGSLPDKLGIRNGDIVHSVNGLSLNSMDGAMKAMGELKSQSQLTFEVTRRGQPVKMTYNIQ